MKAIGRATEPVSIASARTREQLILAAERLFAERGIDGVSLRQINLEAGQRNSSAAHYHFGSKLSLIESISDYRLERINRRRREMLDALGPEGMHDVRAVVEAIVQPISEEITASEDGSCFIRFLAQLIGHPQVKLEDIWASRFATDMKRAIGLLRRALPDIPPAILAQRFGLMWEQIIHTLADRERLNLSETSSTSRGYLIFVSNLVDVVSGGLSAPVSGPTRRHLDSTHSESIGRPPAKR